MCVSMNCHNADEEVREQFLELVLCFYIEGSRDWTQILKFGKQLYPLSHLTSV